MGVYSSNIAVVLLCEGMGDYLFAIPVIKKLSNVLTEKDSKFVLFTHHPNLFKNCPYIHKAYDIHHANEIAMYKNSINLFDTSKLRHYLVEL